MNIGVYGGTFNPVHFGHMRTAEEVYYKFKLKQVIFVPSANPPHKDENVIDPMHRLKMLTLAITGNDHFTVSDLEIIRPGKSYTIDTIKELKRLNPETDFYFILGRDAFMEINSWHQWKALFAETNFIITTRPGSPKISPSRMIPEEIRSQFKRMSSSQKDECEFINNLGKKIIFTKVTNIDISSSDIRQMVREGKSIRYLTPRRVREYIIENGLYQR